jgi:Tfp pilus assembly protein PilO
VNVNRLWVLGAVLLMSVVALMGWSLGISPMLSESRDATAERVAVEAQNTSYELQLATLKQQFESIDGLRVDLADLRQAVPQGANIPQFVGQLDSIALQNTVALTTITVSDAQSYAAALATTAAPEAAPPAEGAVAASPPAEDAAAAGATADAAVPVAPVVAPADNLIAVPISLSVEGGYQNVLDFISGLQQGERLVTVTAFGTTATAEDAPGMVTGTITALIYVLLSDAA